MGSAQPAAPNAEAGHPSRAAEVAQHSGQPHDREVSLQQQDAADRATEADHASSRHVDCTDGLAGAADRPLLQPDASESCSTAAEVEAEAAGFNTAPALELASVGSYNPVRPLEALSAELHDDIGALAPPAAAAAAGSGVQESEGGRQSPAETVSREERESDAAIVFEELQAQLSQHPDAPAGR